MFATFKHPMGILGNRSFKFVLQSLTHRFVIHWDPVDRTRERLHWWPRDFLLKMKDWFFQTVCEFNHSGKIDSWNLWLSLTLKKPPEKLGRNPLISFLPSSLCDTFLWVALESYERHSCRFSACRNTKQK